MKRKDMVKLMSDEYRKMAIIRLTTEQIMDHVLEKMEKNGIAPPADPSTSSPFGGHACQWEYDGENHE
jgi:hypothetical protein